jgi:adenylosuccinate synthase
LNDEELNAFLATVKNLIEQKVGGTLTDEETANVNSLLNESVVALKETESSQTADGQINALKGLLTELKSVVDQVSKVVVENGTAVEALTFEVTNLKKNARTFGQKPFVNESTKLNIGSAYVDPHARHRQQMKEIEEKTRIQNQKS